MDSQRSHLHLPENKEITYMKPVIEDVKEERYELISDDCDIIPKTPVANKKKLKKKKCKKNAKNYHEECIKINFDEKYTIQSTKTGSFDFNKPYVYHSLEEIMNYKEDLIPKNNNIQLIGALNFDQQQGFYLVSISNNLKISLDFTVSPKRPKEKDIVSVFGSIEFNNNVPIFVVRFFRPELEITVSKYIENLQSLRRFIPTEYFKVIQCSGGQISK